MDALEFARELKRMCESFENCRECVLLVEGFGVDYCGVEKLEKAIPIVEKWSKEHPKVTNKEVLFEALNKMTDRELAEALEFDCDKCPIKNYCDSFREGVTCQEIMVCWLRGE